MTLVDLKIILGSFKRTLRLWNGPSTARSARVTSEIVCWSVIHLSLVGRFNFNHATIAEVKMAAESNVGRDLNDRLRMTSTALLDPVEKFPIPDTTFPRSIDNCISYAAVSW
jgi:hypothetical protein